MKNAVALIALTLCFFVLLAPISNAAIPVRDISTFSSEEQRWMNFIIFGTPVIIGLLMFITWLIFPQWFKDDPK